MESQHFRAMPRRKSVTLERFPAGNRRFGRLRDILARTRFAERVGTRVGRRSFRRVMAKVTPRIHIVRMLSRAKT